MLSCRVSLCVLFVLFCTLSPSHLCPSGTKHQALIPKGLPNPGDYPASSPPFSATFFFHVELVIVTLGR